MNIEIKSVQNLTDIKAAMALVTDVFMKFEAPEYTTQGVNHFLEFIEARSMQARIDRNEIHVWCAVLHHKIVGVIAMRPPFHVSLLFVDEHHHRQGIAKHMLHYAIDHYPSSGSTVTVHASPYAVAAYRKMKFHETGPMQTASGIRYHPMSYELETHAD